MVLAVKKAPELETALLAARLQFWEDPAVSPAAAGMGWWMVDSATHEDPFFRSQTPAMVASDMSSELHFSSIFAFDSSINIFCKFSLNDLNESESF